MTPEPRTTWIKPETQRFLHRLWLTVLIVGSLIALLVVSGWAINAAYARGERQREDQDVLEKLKDQPTLSVEERIQEREAVLAKLQDSVSKEEERRVLAGLYEEQGKKRISEGRQDEAEASFRRAIDLDPLNPVYPADLALLFGLAARDADNDRAAQIQLWRESCSHWLKALSLEGKVEFRTAYAQSATDAAISACELMTDPKLRADGLAFLADVRRQMPVGSRTLDQLDRAAAALRGE